MVTTFFYNFLLFQTFYIKKPLKSEFSNHFLYYVIYIKNGHLFYVQNQKN